MGQINSLYKQKSCGTSLYAQQLVKITWINF